VRPCSRRATHDTSSPTPVLAVTDHAVDEYQGLAASLFHCQETFGSARAGGRAAVPAAVAQTQVAGTIAFATTAKPCCASRTRASQRGSGYPRVHAPGKRPHHARTNGIDRGISRPAAASRAATYLKRKAIRGHQRSSSSSFVVVVVVVTRDDQVYRSESPLRPGCGGGVVTPKHGTR